MNLWDFVDLSPIIHEFLLDYRDKGKNFSYFCALLFKNNGLVGK